MFIIYGKEDCPMCFKIKTVLELLGKDYEYKELDVDYTTEEFEEKFPNTLALPQIIFNDKHLGDANQTLKYLKEHRVI
tara:strand:- start:4201 stop:4434 length:234 start_codon:yes stop_codon:yes gene_type:complete